MIILARCTQCRIQIELTPEPDAPYGRMPDSCPGCGRTDTTYNLGVEVTQVEINHLKLTPDQHSGASN